MIFKRKAKLIATLGPSSSDFDVIKNLAIAGADVFRLNFSHGNHETHKRNASNIRIVENEIEKPLAIMMDLQGPKIRVGVFEDGKVSLKRGSKFIFDLEKDFGTSKRVCLPHPEIFNSIIEGTEILIDDGKVKMKIVENNGNKIVAEVMNGGIISNKKGVNIPNIMLPITALTEKDRKDVEVIKDIDANWIAVSFVQSADDVMYARSFVDDSVGVLAKIEKPMAVKNIDSILGASDAIMIARGDLGVEIPFETLPGIQLSLIEKAREHGKPVVVATQMLESMVACKVPTRAEVSDVACAIAQEADAVMLSAESANGEYPEDAVAVMDRIIRQTEIDGLSFSKRICEKSHVFFNGQNIKVIVAFTESGRTALSVAKDRPTQNIIAFTPNLNTARKLSIAAGIQSIIVDEIFSFSQMVQVVQRKLKDFFDDGDEVLIVAGIPFRISGETNLFHICKINKKIDED